MTRRLSGFKPTGHLQLGNYLGAIRPMVDSQHDTDSVVAVVDLHALTVTHDPAGVRALTLEAATLLLAAGVDPDVSLLYVQSPRIPGTCAACSPPGRAGPAHGAPASSGGRRTRWNCWIARPDGGHPSGRPMTLKETP
jgi:hypothetical protein